MALPIAPTSRRQSGSTTLRPMRLAALALALALTGAGAARAAEPARSPYPPTFQVAGTAAPASRLHPAAATPASDAPQARPRFSPAPGFQWGCPVDATRGCW